MTTDINKIGATLIVMGLVKIPEVSVAPIK